MSARLEGAGKRLFAARSAAHHVALSVQQLSSVVCTEHGKILYDRKIREAGNGLCLPELAVRQSFCSVCLPALQLYGLWAMLLSWTVFVSLGPLLWLVQDVFAPLPDAWLLSLQVSY